MAAVAAIAPTTTMIVVVDTLAPPPTIVPAPEDWPPAAVAGGAGLAGAAGGFCSCAKARFMAASQAAATAMADLVMRCSPLDGRAYREGPPRSMPCALSQANEDAHVVVVHVRGIGKGAARHAHEALPFGAHRHALARVELQ